MLGPQASGRSASSQNVQVGVPKPLKLQPHHFLPILDHVSCHLQEGGSVWLVTHTSSWADHWHNALQDLYCAEMRSSAVVCHLRSCQGRTNGRSCQGRTNGRLTGRLAAFLDLVVARVGRGVNWIIAMRPVERWVTLRLPLWLMNIVPEMLLLALVTAWKREGQFAL